MSRKIIFLDIDGVIATDATYAWLRGTGVEPTVTDDLDRLHGLIDAVMAARVRRIVDATGAEIVVSSSWRNMFPWDDLRIFLAHHLPEPVDHTPIRVPRGEAIWGWLEANGVPHTDCVILDDSDCKPMNGRRIQTSERLGLTERHVAHALRMLGVSP